MTNTTNSRSQALIARCFDARWYGNRYPDIIAAGVDPTRHYAEHGWREDRWPNPWFDPSWYRAMHGIDDARDPLTHYLTVGFRKDLAPCPDFDPVWYRRIYTLLPDEPPLADFLHRRHSRTVAPSAALWPALGLTSPVLTPVADDVFLSLQGGDAAETLLRPSGLFDENYYALHSGDVLDAGAEPLAHYCGHGWREGRRPGLYFDNGWYCATNPDVERMGVNPLAHYLIVGEVACRCPVVFFDPGWYAQAHGLPDGTSPLAHFLRHRRDGDVSPTPLFDPIWYAAQRNEPVHAGRDPFARFLLQGMTDDIPPSPEFDMTVWRRSMGHPSSHFRHLRDPERDNPLVRYLLSTYR